MKKFVYLFIFLLSFCGFSQDWKSTYKEALSISKAENKSLLVVFSGTDWCAPCIKLDKQIFRSEEFIRYASNNYVLYRADFPKKKANQLPKEIVSQNKLLAESYNKKGYFPLVVVLNKEEDILGSIGYKNTSANVYIEYLNAFIP